MMQWTKTSVAIIRKTMLDGIVDDNYTSLSKLISTQIYKQQSKLIKSQKTFVKATLQSYDRV